MSNESEHELTHMVIDLLESMNYKILRPLKEPNNLLIRINHNKKKLDFYIFVYPNKINLQLHYPLYIKGDNATEINTFVGNYNIGKAFSVMRYNTCKGQLYYDYTFLVHAETFNKADFITIIYSLLDEAVKNHERIEFILNSSIQ